MFCTPPPFTLLLVVLISFTVGEDKPSLFFLVSEIHSLKPFYMGTVLTVVLLEIAKTEKLRSLSFLITAFPLLGAIIGSKQDFTL